MRQILSSWSFVLVLLLVLTLAIGACAKSGSEYLGKWSDPAQPNRGSLEVSRNGESYLVIIAKPVFGGGKPESVSIPAVGKDGLLHIQGAFGETTLTYMKASDGLLFSSGMGGSTEMKRVK